MFGFFKKTDPAEAPLEVPAQYCDGQGNPLPFATTALGLARYKVEHEFLRQYYFTNTAGLVDSIMTKYQLGDLYYAVMKQDKVKYIYAEDFFRADTDKTERGDYILTSALPEPEHEGLFYRMYFVFDAAVSPLAFYAIERTEDGAVLRKLGENEADDEVLGSVAEPVWGDNARERKYGELALVTEAYYGEPVGIVGENPAAPAADDAEAEETDAAEAEDAEAVDAEPTEDAEAVDADPADDAETAPQA